MLSSKANAALMRVKEIEEKYKMKRREQKWNRKEDIDSSISSVSLNLSKNLPMQLKESSGNSPKPKLDIKMPDMRFEDHEESAKFPLQDKQSDKMNLAVDEADLDVAMLSEDKSSSRSIRKQESFASDITIQENSSIESILDDSIISSKSLSRSKTSQRRSNEEYSRHEGSTKAGPKSEKEKLDKLSDMREKSSSANSSIIKRSKLSEKSNKNISKPRSNSRSREYSLEEKRVIRTLKGLSSDRSSRNSNHSILLRNNSVIDESIDTLENDSEIISELSRIEKSIVEKTANGSVNVSSNSGLSLAENASANVSNDLKHPADENGYMNDTFEDISSSTVRSKSISQSEKIMDEKKNIISLTDNRNTDDVKISSNKEPSNDVKNVENIDEKTGKRVPQRKGSVEMTSASRQESDWEERGKVSDETRERLMMDVVGLPVADEQSTERTKSGSSREKSEPTKSSSSKEKSEVMKSGSLREKNESMKSGSSREKSEPTKFTSSRKKTERSEEDENVLAENSDRRIPQNVTNVLRKMHRDAIDAMARRHASLKTVEKVYEDSSGRKTETETLGTTSRRMVTREKTRREKSRHRSSEENKTIENTHNDCEHNTKRKKRKARVIYSEPIETRDCAGSHKEYKALRYDRKQIRELQKRVVELRLYQEREDLQKYIHELKDLRLGGSGSTPNYFSPLEFPKIAEFVPPDPLDFESNPDDQLAVLRERVSAIRRWLKDQYILYRDYCAVAQAINARYVPTTLEDTKKTIRELRKTTIKIR